MLAVHNLADIAPFGDQVAGVDEVGRGPLAGPVVAAAVILDPSKPIEGLADSKKLSAAKREALARTIRQRALAYAIADAQVAEIDEINILHATMLAMARSVDQLGVVPSVALIDGNRLPKLTLPALAVVRGDARVAAISAASILAKVTRDRLMCKLSLRYPGYGFERHAGYGTKAHLQALAALGPCAIHRRSFAPVRDLLPENAEPRVAPGRRALARAARV